jgi:hypothetical protein
LEVWEMAASTDGVTRRRRKYLGFRTIVAVSWAFHQTCQWDINNRGAFLQGSLQNFFDNRDCLDMQHQTLPLFFVPPGLIVGQLSMGVENFGCHITELDLSN